MDANPYQSSPADPLDSSRSVSPRVVSELVGTKPWVRLFAVLGCLAAALMLLVGLGYLVAGLIGVEIGSVGTFGGLGVRGFLVGSGVFYLLFGLLYLFPSIKLWKFGSSIRQLQLTQGSAELEQAMTEQRGFWKFAGIMVIVGVGMMILLVIGMAVLAATMGAQGGFDIPLDGGTEG